MARARRAATPAAGVDLRDLLAGLWEAAVALRGSIEPADYKRYVLPVIFLRFPSRRADRRRAELESLLDGPKSDYDTADPAQRKAVLADPDESPLVRGKIGSGATANRVVHRRAERPMGWVTTSSGHRYLYRSVRRGGRVVREYLGRDDDFGRLMEAEWRRRKLDAALARLDADAARAKVFGRLARLERLADDGRLVAVCHGLLAGLGYHRHRRGEWRMRRGLNKLKAQLETLEAAARKPRPLLDYQAPADDAEAVAVFAAARAGDREAVAKLPALIRDRKWVEWMGDLGRQAQFQLVWRVAKSDPVMKAGLQAKLADLWKELAGEDPTVLETLLVRRVLNGWLLTHALEVEFALATDPKTQDHLDKLLGRSQRRLTQAVRELARVRRLQAPAVLAKLQLAVAS